MYEGKSVFVRNVPVTVRYVTLSCPRQLNVVIDVTFSYLSAVKNQYIYIYFWCCLFVIYIVFVVPDVKLFF